MRDSWGNRRILEEDEGERCHTAGLLADCVPVNSKLVTNGQEASCLDPATGQPGENVAQSSSCADRAMGSFLVIFPANAQPRRKEAERLLLTAANLYSGGFNVTNAGSYVVSLVLDVAAGGARGLKRTSEYVHIRHSPFEIKIVAGQTSPAHSDTRGECAQRAHAHQPCSFSVVLRDSFSNRRDGGGDDVRAWLQGPLAFSDRPGRGPAAQNLPVIIRDLENGEYSITYMVTLVGRYTLAVSVEGADVASSPFRLSVQGGFQLTCRHLSDTVAAYAHPNVSLMLLHDAHIQGAHTPTYMHTHPTSHSHPAHTGLHLSAVRPGPNSLGAAWFRAPQVHESCFLYT